MSRIQQILSKAERDGTMRRTQSVPSPLDPAPQETATSRGARRATSGYDVSVTHVPYVGSSASSAEPRVVEAGTLSPLLVAATEPHAPVAEQYRALRTRLTFIEQGHGRRVLLVTSPSKGDGKSVTVSNLALTMAQEFSRHVALVDADLRRPSLHKLFGLPPAPGLAEVLAGEAALDDVLVLLPDYHLTILPAGVPPAQPTELLGSSPMRRVLDALRSRFDRVLVDSPPALPLADVGVLSALTDGMLLVVRAGVTPKPLIERALGICDSSRLAGLVLNDTGGSDARYVEYAAHRARG
jgi:polysaccharide biosynthesis transport protein